jgi:sugar phosphate isomerase/epimerase
MDSMPQLLATCWTSAGNVRPGLTADESPIPIDVRVRAVAAAGYSGIGLELADLEVVRQSIGFTALRDMIGAAGLTTIEVEFLNDWCSTGDRRVASDARRALLLEAAGELGAHHIKAGSGQPADSRDLRRVRGEFEALADEAEAHGTRIALEPAAHSGLDVITAAIPMVVGLAHPAGGILLDPWHLYRAGVAYEMLDGTLPAEFLFAVELSDAPAEPVGTLFDDTFDNRLVPGNGAFDVPAFVRVVATIGFDGPWGIEMMSRRSRSLPVEVALAEAAAGARAALAAAGVS